MKFLEPNHVLRQFGIYGTQDVADIGSGAGHFALSAAKRLEGGRLFAVDVEKEMLARLVNEARELGHKNLHPIWGDASRLGGVPLADSSMDRIIVTNVLFQVDNRSLFVEEVKRMLRPNGKILLVEWKNDVKGGPHDKHKVSFDEALKIFARHGFTKEQEIDAGDFHYGIILVRA